MRKKYWGISRIDSSNTHGWYVRIYANKSVFCSKLFSDGVYGGKNKALKNAIVFRDHNKMVSELNKKDCRAGSQKPFFEKPPKNNTSGVVGVNEVKTISRGRNVHYFQSTWSENGKGRTRKYYVTSERTRDEAFEQAVDYRKQKEEELRQCFLEESNS